MNWIPFVIFILAALSMSAIQRQYFGRLARQGRVPFEEDVASAIRAQPSRLPWIVSGATQQWLASLIQHQTDPHSERLRWVACAAIVLTLVSFVWVLISFGSS